jgi:hypothetical protein
MLTKMTAHSYLQAIRRSCKEAEAALLANDAEALVQALTEAHVGVATVLEEGVRLRD